VSDQRDQRNDDRWIEQLLRDRRVSRRDVLRGAAVGGMFLAGGSLLAACSSGSPSTNPSGSASTSLTPKSGGNLAVAILGGSDADTVDAHSEVSQPDSSRVMTLYEGLVRLDLDGKLVNILAEEMTPNADATMWTIKVKSGVTFHNGKTLKAEDIQYTFQRIADPKAPKAGATALAPLDIANIKIVDDQTLQVPMKTPYASFPESISAVYFFGVVPIGYDPKKPVGTGAFKLDSFTPGQQSVMSKFSGYWQTGLPYLDSVTIIDSFGTDTAAFNALQGGQVQAFAYAPLSLVQQAQSGGPIKALVSKPGQWTPFTMRVDTAPFNDVRVRQAFRLIVDRKQLIAQSLSGYGSVGNDVFSQWDHCYDGSLKRDQDLGQAKSLLSQAGQAGLTVELVTSDFAAGVVQAAQVFAQQAKGAGVTVKVRQVPAGVFYGTQYLSWPFAQDYWAYSPYLSQVAQGSVKTAPFNETHWDDPTYNNLYAQAQATTDATKRCELINEMEKIDYDQGGYIIASYNQGVDLLAKNVEGFEPAATGIALGNFGFDHAWMS
jgi:peptide/nickel transport system substrate-binding protein